MPDLRNQPELALPFQTTRELLAKWNERDRDRVALVDLDQGGRSVTWGDVSAAASRISGLLGDMGIGRGDKVVLLADEVMEKLIVWLGIWHRGAIVCPLNVEMNEAHLARIIATINPKLVLWHEELEGSSYLNEIGLPDLRFGWYPQAPKGDGSSDPFFTRLADYPGTDDADGEGDVGPEDLSCIFCTSGTTSTPKSVVYNHLSYWLSGLSTLDMLGLNADDRTLEYRSFGWNSAQILSFMPWLQVGSTLHIARHFSRSRFFDWVRDYGITFSAGVPTVVNMLLNDPPDEQGRDVPTLRLMTCSTAPLSPEQWERFESLYGVTLLQLYGMSEAGWICGNRHYRRRMGTVGPPARHQEFRIVDGEGNPCAAGVEGEITVGGPQTCHSTFSLDGSVEDLSDARIRTGDLGFMDADGFVTVTGRTKDLIIRGGVNIAPLEIDNLILSHPKVREAAVIGVPDQIYGEEIVAYVVAIDGENLSAQEVDLWCEQKLPDFKRPRQVRFIDQLPRSDRGKVLRDDLKQLWSNGQSA